MSATTAKQFEIWTSDKSFRYKEEAIHNHAPQSTGIYSIVSFDAEQQGKTLYMGLVQDSTIFKALFEHWEGLREPKVQDLLARYPSVYFMYIVQSNAQTSEDQQDLFWALAQQEKPELMDWKNLPNTGRYSEITVKDKSIL